MHFANVLPISGCLACRSLQQTGKHVATGVERHSDAGVSGPLAHDLRVHPLREHQGRTGVPKVVESNRRQAGLTGGSREGMADLVRIRSGSISPPTSAGRSRARRRLR